MIRLLGVAPAAIFIFFAFLVASMLLLTTYPASEILWWVNIEIYSRFRTGYYLLEALVPSAPVLFLFLAASALLTIRASHQQNRLLIFLMNHVAAMLVGVSLVAPGAAPLAAAGEVVARGAPLIPQITIQPVWALLAMALCTASCVGSHVAVLRHRHPAP